MVRCRSRRGTLVSPCLLDHQARANKDCVFRGLPANRDARRLGHGVIETGEVLVLDALARDHADRLRDFAQRLRGVLPSGDRFGGVRRIPLGGLDGDLAELRRIFPIGGALRHERPRMQSRESRVRGEARRSEGGGQPRAGARMDELSFPSMELDENRNRESC